MADLLKSHLTNWSLGGNHKRVSILIGIAYDADLVKAKELLRDILNNEERVLKNPEPSIHFEQFNTNAIDIKIYFWTRHLKEANSTKSALIVAINELFKANNIVIPFTRQDVYIHNAPQAKKRDL